MSVYTSTVIDMPLSFLRMPPEIIACIADNMLEMNHDRSQPARWSWTYSEPEPVFNPLQRYKDALSLAGTCKTLYGLLTKQIYRTDVLKNNSAALLRSAKKDSLEGVTRSLEAGANIATGDTTKAIVFREPISYMSMDSKVHNLFSGIWNPLDLSNQVTALHWAAYLGHQKIVSLLLENGADINHRVHVEVVADAIESHRGSTEVETRRILDPYHTNFSCDIVAANVEEDVICLEVVEEEVAKWTLKHGANPLYFAIEGGDWGTIKLLIDAGAKFVTHTGCSVHAIHQAVRNGDIGVVELLLQHEPVAANTNTILDSRGATALHYLKYDSEDGVFKNCRIIRELVNHGFQVNTTDGYDALPIKEAMLRHSNTVTAEFIRCGSLIPDGLPCNVYDVISPPCSEIKEALEEANRKGFAFNLHYEAPLMVTTSSARIRMYRHFYKLVCQTSEVPEPMNSHDANQWEAFWNGRPFVHVAWPALGGLVTSGE
ncbi:hypothetical protein FSPOR_7107 [Fusarium sporotrichioides]|uniref:Uncharacterized protein n=1 Tax=Fusarium sporotrichioides TaxID=5514 RepID=A0A395S0B4_FUSSP|nr:hypothetical protein FSPOR_7107 [Fusarium sporotrichioides]